VPPPTPRDGTHPRFAQGHAGIPSWRKADHSSRGFQIVASVIQRASSTCTSYQPTVARATSDGWRSGLASTCGGRARRRPKRGAFRRQSHRTRTKATRRSWLGSRITDPRCGYGAVDMDVPTLRSERLLLEPLGFGHSLGMFALWSNSDVCRYSGPITDSNGHPIAAPVENLVDSDKIVDYWLRASEAGTGFRWALVEHDTAAFVGTVGFNTLGKCCEYAYHLHPSAWGCGLMSEATQVALGWASSWEPCVEVEAFIDRDNERSIALALRCGFEWCARKSDGTDRYVIRVQRQYRSGSLRATPSGWPGRFHGCTRAPRRRRT